MVNSKGIKVSSLQSSDEDGSITVRLSKQFYEKAAVLSAAYKLTGRCVVQISPSGETEVEAAFKPIAGHTEEGLQALADEFCNDIIDQQLRLDLEKQYGRLRELIVEHAFAPIANLKDRLDGK
jgi:His-Xaa-Ser system protein HxsD